MLLFLVILSFVLFGVSLSTWRNSIRGGISPTGVYALVWGCIWFVHWADFLYYRPVDERALLYSSFPLIAIFLAEQFALAGVGPSVPRTWRLDGDTLRRWALGCGVVALFAGTVILTVSWMTFGNVLSNAQALKQARTLDGLNMYAGSALAMPAKYCSVLLGAAFPGVVLGTLHVRLVNPREWVVVVLPLIGVVLHDLGWGCRVNIFNILLLVLTVNLFLPLPKPVVQSRPCKMRPWRWSSKPSYVLAAILVVGGVVAMNAIGEKTRQKKTLVVGDSELPLSFVQLVDYNAGTLIGFGCTLEETGEDRTWGRMSFRGCEQWLRLLRVIPDSVPIPKQVMEWEEQYIPYQADLDWRRSGNVFTWLRYLYSDFGIIGIVFVPLLIGWTATRAAVACASSEHGLPAVVTVGVLYFVLLTSGGVIPTRNADFVFSVCILYYAVKRIARPARDGGPLTMRHGTAGMLSLRERTRVARRMPLPQNRYELV